MVLCCCTKVFPLSQSSDREKKHCLIHITSFLLAVQLQLTEVGEAWGCSPERWLLIPSVSWPQLWVSKERIAIPVPSHLTSHHPRCIFCQALLPAHLDKKKRREERVFHSCLSEPCSPHACTAVTNTSTDTHTHLPPALSSGQYFWITN